jgi:hypothetical protein
MIGFVEQIVFGPRDELVLVTLAPPYLQARH